MVGAHTHAGEAAVRQHGHGCAPTSATRGESAFSIIELVVVVLIIAILLAIALPNVRSASDGPAAPATAIAGGTVWRAVQQWRLENGGTMPAAPMLTNSGAGLVDPAGERMVRPWPKTGRGEPVVLNASAGVAPPMAGPPNSLAYASAGNTGWLVGYGPRGSIVFKRVIAASAMPAVPAG